MAVLNRKSLVLQGSAVLWVGKAGNPRLGTGSAASPETPEVRISMRHPSLGWGQEYQPARRLRPADAFRMDFVAAYGAGRSRRTTGIRSRSRLPRTTEPASIRGCEVR